MRPGHEAHLSHTGKKNRRDNCGMLLLRCIFSKIWGSYRSPEALHFISKILLRKIRRRRESIWDTREKYILSRRRNWGIEEFHFHFGVICQFSSMVARSPSGRMDWGPGVDRLLAQSIIILAFLPTCIRFTDQQKMQSSWRDALCFAYLSIYLTRFYVGLGSDAVKWFMIFYQEVLQRATVYTT